MKKFIRYLSIFCGIILICFIIAELMARQVPNEYRQKDQYMIQNHSTIKQLVVGSSAVMFGVDPEYMDTNTYNLALVSQDLQRDDFIVNKYLHQCNDLKTLIMDIQYYMPYSFLEDGTEWYRLNWYHIYMGYKTANTKYWLEIMNSNVLYTKVSRFLKFSKEELKFKENGFGTAYTIKTRSPNWKKGGATTAAIHTSKSHIEKEYRKNINFLCDIAKICSQRKVLLILVTPPTNAAYYNYLNQEQLSQMYHMVSIVSEQYPNTVHYIDCLKDPRFTDQDFWDANHLNMEYGAPKLSKIIQQYIDSIETLSTNKLAPFSVTPQKR
jgi:hypothetical protein